MPYHVRMAELWTVSKRRTLSDEEAIELNHCMAANAKYCWDLITLQNMSLAAYIVGDMEWMHAICTEIEAIEKPPNKNSSS